VARGGGGWERNNRKRQKSKEGETDRLSKKSKVIGWFSYLHRNPQKEGWEVRGWARAALLTGYQISKRKGPEKKDNQN